MRVACYARISDRDRQGDNFSIGTQLAKMREYAQSQNWTVTHELTEKDSAFMDGLERAELNKVRELARSGEVDILLFFSPDRFTRDIGDGVILRRELQKCRVKLFCFTPTPHEITSELEIMNILTDWQSQQYVEKLREASIRGVQGKIDMGLYPQGVVPYGYTLTGKKKETRLHIREDEAFVVKLIYELYAFHGKGCNVIARELNDLGIPSNATGKGNVWTPQKVRRIITTEAYTGIWYSNRWKRLGKGKKVRLTEKGTPIAIPTIIDRATWETVQEKLKTRHQGRPHDDTCLMRGLVKCSCGHSMSAVALGNGVTTRAYFYYRCTSYQVKDGRCGAKQWKSDGVDRTVWQFAYELLHNPEKLLTGYREHQQAEEDERELYKEQIASLTAQIEEQRETLAQMIEHRNLTKSRSVQAIQDRQIEEYGEALDALEARKASLEKVERTSALTDEDIKRLTREVTAIKEMLEALHTINEEADLEAQRAIIERLNLRCTLRTDEEGARWVDIHWLRNTEPRKLHVQKEGTASHSVFLNTHTLTFPLLLCVGK